MASSGLSSIVINDKLKLSEDQMNNLISTVGMSKEFICNQFENMLKKFPSGFITEAEFLQIICCEPSDSEKRCNDLIKFIFHIIDRCHTGKIDLYDYILTIGWLIKNEPDVAPRFITRLCNSDLTGTVNEAVVIDFVSTFSNRFMNDDGPDQQKENEAICDQCRSIVKAAFNGNDKVSEQEFVKICTENEEMQQFAQTIHGVILMAMAYANIAFQ